MPRKILGVVGARPNFMKIDPVFRALERDSDSFSTWLVHTGQHYDENMSKIFFDDLGMRAPDIDLGIGPGTHAEQTGKIMVDLERILIEKKPNLVLVVGDVNSTMAATLAAAKLCIPIAHVEAGLRSFDRTMPEEINRIVTDALADLLFTPSPEADDNLRREGVPEDRIHRVGNVMIDTLLRCQQLAEDSPVFGRLGLHKNGYALLTLHRPSNVDNPAALEEIVDALEEIQRVLPIVFPVHPRTRKQIEAFGLQQRVDDLRGILTMPPLGYMDFIALEMHARLVLTDSGGIQEETTVLGIPCLTLRETTERPITVTQGTNRIVGHDKKKIRIASRDFLQGPKTSGRIPDLWDGRAAERIVKVLKTH